MPTPSAMCSSCLVQNVSAEEGFKSNDRAYVMIGHGGNRENDEGHHENRGGTDYGSDSGHISVGNGDNSGDITVEAGRLVSLVSNRAESFSRIGHGGMGHDDPDLAAATDELRRCRTTLMCALTTTARDL